MNKASTSPSPDDDSRVLQQLAGSEPTPEMAVLCADQIAHLLDKLPDDEFRQVALWKMEGFKNRETADKLGTYEVKVERGLRIIRKLWAGEVEHDDD